MTQRISVQVDVVRVQDGDSLVVRPKRSIFAPWRSAQEIRARLYGIDAPESDQQHGGEAREYLRRLVSGRNDLVLDTVDTDRYGRQVAILYYRRAGRSRSINRLMVEQGLAYWYRRYGGHGLGLEGAEQEAKRRRRGVWASGGQVKPWDHRQAQRRAKGRAGLLKWILLGTVIGAVVGAALVWTVIA